MARKDPCFEGGTPAEAAVAAAESHEEGEIAISA